VLAPGQGTAGLLSESPAHGDRSGSRTLILPLEIAMNLSTGEITLILAGCVLVIGGIVIAWQRGLFGAKPAAPAAEAKPASGEVAK
jgi:hypothetical protein